MAGAAKKGRKRETGLGIDQQRGRGERNEWLPARQKKTRGGTFW